MHSRAAMQNKRWPTLKRQNRRTSPSIEAKVSRSSAKSRSGMDQLSRPCFAGPARAATPVPSRNTQGPVPMKIALIALLAGALAVATSRGEDAPSRLGDLSEADTVAALTKFADEAAKGDRFSGAILVARNDNILLQRAWGHADREKGTAASVETRFRMGSMNKMFTAIAVLQLIEAGKLGLNDPILKYLPDYPNRDLASKVTVRSLLTHTGGTGDIFGAPFWQNR